MKIGNGLLKIGIFGNKKENSITELKGLAKDTLKFFPLGDLVKVSEIMLFPPEVFYDYLINIENFETLRYKKDLDIIAIIYKGRNVYCPLRGLVYSDLDTIKFAHELGHGLGLEHPTKECGAACSTDRVQCKHYNQGEIMGCAPAVGRAIGFSNENIQQLSERGHLI